MGFISMLVVSGFLELVLLVLLGIAILAAALLILCIVFAILYQRSKKGTDSSGGTRRGKRWQMGLSIICLILSVFNFSIVAFAYKVATAPSTTTIETDGGEITILQEDGFELERAIEMDSSKKAAGILEERPELMDYITLDGYTLLGLAISNHAVDVAAYLLEQGVNVEAVGQTDTGSAISLYCWVADGGRFHAEMINLLLDYGADVNKTTSAMPPVQFIIQFICKDNDLSNDDLTLLKRFVDAGADLMALNGSDEDAITYFKKMAEKELLNDIQPQQVEKGLNILAK